MDWVLRKKDQSRWDTIARGSFDFISSLYAELNKVGFLWQVSSREWRSDDMRWQAATERNQE